jgi:hypothetical protein
MRSLLLAFIVTALTAAAALAQTTCPNGQTYDQAQKKCVSTSAKGSGY